MAQYPSIKDDTVLYDIENVYGDKDITVRMLDDSKLSIWGSVFVDGNPLANVGALPIATQAEAEAGVDNTKVMTPLRTSQAIDAQASAGGVTSVNGETGIVVLNQDEVLDGTTYKQYSQTEKTKLAGIASGATVNSPDATLLNRANHTGTQTADTIVDGTTNHVFTAADDTKLAGIANGATVGMSQAAADARYLQLTGGAITGDLLVSGYGEYSSTSVSTYFEKAPSCAEQPGNANRLTRRDYVDNGDTAAKARANHTGTQSADTIVDGTTNHVFTGADDTKLTGIATGATANSSDATLLNRANHTGSQAESTVTNLVTDLAAKAPLRYTVVNSASTAYTLALTDEPNIINFTAATAIALTVPTNASVAFAVGTKLDFFQSGAGKITVGGAGVTIRATPSLVLRAQYSAASLIKIATDEWLLTGDLT